MTYNEIKPILKEGYIASLPKFEGYFKWDYNTNDIQFINKDFRCQASSLDILNRNDFYKII